MVFKIRITAVLAMVLSVAVLSTAVTTGYKYISVSAAYKNRNTVILDAGHGGLVNTIDYVKTLP